MKLDLFFEVGFVAAPVPERAEARIEGSKHGGPPLCRHTTK
jgi:hypothetical protein